ncbi:MAG: NAD(P)H nitroreductase [Alteromonadaceae bacterium]|nr:NAD(P)H nitroreductase [Alteromonadaceae bacterium]
MNVVEPNNINFLLNRQSNPILTEPAPEQEHLQLILSAGMRVPDHGGLLPWHFTIVKEDGLERLSQLFVRAAKKNNAEEAKLEKAAKMPFRAPLIIIVSTKFKEHIKVPKQEQLIAAGCSVHAMQMAAYALGYGAMWRTGEFSYNALIKEGLNIDNSEEIVGFLYIGTVARQLPQKPSKDPQNCTSYL